MQCHTCIKMVSVVTMATYVDEEVGIGHKLAVQPQCLWSRGHSSGLPTDVHTHAQELLP